MTPETAREPRFKTAPGKYFTPNPEAKIPLFSPVPRATRQYWGLATKLQKEFLELLVDHSWKGEHQATQQPDQSWTIRRVASKTALATALDVTPRTITRLFKSCRAKHFLSTELDYYKGTRKIKSRRVTVFSFRRALQLRLDDPEIAKTTDRRTVYCGRGKTPLTPESAEYRWQMDLSNVPQFDDELTVGDVPQEQAAPATVREFARPAPPPVPEDDPIYAAFDDMVTGVRPSRQDGFDCYARVDDATIPRAVVAEWIRDAYGKVLKRNPAQILSVGWFIGKPGKPGILAGYLDSYRDPRAAAARAREAARAAPPADWETGADLVQRIMEKRGAG